MSDTADVTTDPAGISPQWSEGFIEGTPAQQTGSNIDAIDIIENLDVQTVNSSQSGEDIAASAMLQADLECPPKRDPFTLVAGRQEEPSETTSSNGRKQADEKTINDIPHTEAIAPASQAKNSHHQRLLPRPYPTRKSTFGSLSKPKRNISPSDPAIPPPPENDYDDPVFDVIDLQDNFEYIPVKERPQTAAEFADELLKKYGGPSIAFENNQDRNSVTTELKTIFDFKELLDEAREKYEERLQVEKREERAIKKLYREIKQEYASLKDKSTKDPTLEELIQQRLHDIESHQLENANEKEGTRLLQSKLCNVSFTEASSERKKSQKPTKKDENASFSLSTSNVLLGESSNGNVLAVDKPKISPPPQPREDRYPSKIHLYSTAQNAKLTQSGWFGRGVINEPPKGEKTGNAKYDIPPAESPNASFNRLLWDQLAGSIIAQKVDNEEIGTLLSGNQSNDDEQRKAPLKSRNRSASIRKSEKSEKNGVVNAKQGELSPESSTTIKLNNSSEEKTRVRSKSLKSSGGRERSASIKKSKSLVIESSNDFGSIQESAVFESDTDKKTELPRVFINKVSIPVRPVNPFAAARDFAADKSSKRPRSKSLRKTESPSENPKGVESRDTNSIKKSLKPKKVEPDFLTMDDQAYAPEFTKFVFNFEASATGETSTQQQRNNHQFQSTYSEEISDLKIRFIPNTPRNKSTDEFNEGYSYVDPHPKPPLNSNQVENESISEAHSSRLEGTMHLKPFASGTIQRDYLNLVSYIEKQYSQGLINGDVVPLVAGAITKANATHRPRLTPPFGLMPTQTFAYY